MRQTVFGRSIDIGCPKLVRFTATDVERLLTATWSYYDEPAPAAHLKRLKTLESCPTVLLGVPTLGTSEPFVRPVLGTATRPS